MRIRVRVAKNITSGSPFSARVSSDALATVTLTLSVEGAARQFGIIVGDEEVPKGASQIVSVEGALRLKVNDWGSAPKGATFALSAAAGDATDADEGIVLIEA